MAHPNDIKKKHFFGTSSSKVTIPAPGPGKTNYLSEIGIDVDSDTVFTVESPEGNPIWKHNIGAGIGYEKTWASHPLPGNPNAEMIINVSAGSFIINHVGVVA